MGAVRICMRVKASRRQARAGQDRTEQWRRWDGLMWHAAYRWVADPRLSVCSFRFYEKSEGSFKLLGLLLGARGALGPLLRVLVLLVVFVVIALPLLLTALRVLLLANRTASFVDSGGGGGSWSVVKVVFEEKVLELRSDVPHLGSFDSISFSFTQFTLIRSDRVALHRIGCSCGECAEGGTDANASTRGRAGAVEKEKRENGPVMF